MSKTTTTTPEIVLQEMAKFVGSSRNVDVYGKNRTEEVVLSRAAIYNACKGLLSLTRAARLFGQNHATVLHHQRKHDVNSTVRFYRDLYEDLMDIRARFDVSVRSRHQDLVEQMDKLVIENERLRAENNEFRAMILQKEGAL